MLPLVKPTVLLPLLPVEIVLPLDVTEEVDSGFVVDHERVTEHVLFPAEIIHDEGETDRLPDISSFISLTVTFVVEESWLEVP